MTGSQRRKTSDNRAGDAPPIPSDVIARVELARTVACWMCTSLLMVLSAAADEPPARRADGATQIPVGVAGSLQNPAFSPSGDQLLVTSFHNGYNLGPASMHVFSFSSGTPAVLTSAPDSDNVNLPGSVWNGATSRVVFSSDRQDTEEIWTVLGSGGGEERITHHVTAEWYLEPSFSPDGQWIVFEVDPDVPEPQRMGTLWKVQSNGGTPIQLTFGLADGTDDRQPNWSPQGDRIVFQRRNAGSDDWNLFTIAPDGSALLQVTTSPASDTDASWSPDGTRLIYSSDSGELAFASLFAIPSGGGTPWRITTDDARYDGAPSWSPDGTFAAFESCPGDPDSGTGTSLWRIDLEVPLFWDGFESGDEGAWSP